MRFFRAKRMQSLFESTQSDDRRTTRELLFKYANLYLHETVSTRDISLVPEAVLCESIFLETTV